MTKNAIIKISLLPQADGKEDEAIRTQITENTSPSSIPFCAKINEVRIEEPEEITVKKLSTMGLPNSVANNVAMVYRGSNQNSDLTI